MFENRAMGIIFGPKWDEVTGGWEKLHIEELRDLYSYTKTNSMAFSPQANYTD
jgi:hypothetical protein